MSGIKSLVVTICATVSAATLVLLTVVQVLHWQASRQEFDQLRKELREPRYEYKVLAIQSEGHDRTGDDAMKFTSITPSEKELSVLGAGGWEIVGTYLEMETAFPNFGKAEYVTGMQPNVRPQRVVLILRHRIA